MELMLNGDKWFYFRSTIYFSQSETFEFDLPANYFFVLDQGSEGDFAHAYVYINNGPGVDLGMQRSFSVGPSPGHTVRTPSCAQTAVRIQMVNDRTPGFVWQEYKFTMNADITYTRQNQSCVVALTPML